MLLRVLGNLLEMPDCDYLSAEAIGKEALAAIGNLQADNRIAAGELPEPASRKPAAELPMYRVDALVRRAPALQQTGEALRAAATDGASRQVA